MQLFLQDVEQIVAVLKQVEVGVPVAEVRRQAGITEKSYLRNEGHFSRAN